MFQQHRHPDCFSKCYVVCLNNSNANYYYPSGNSSYKGLQASVQMLRPHYMESIKFNITKISGFQIIRYTYKSHKHATLVTNLILSRNYACTNKNFTALHKIDVNYSTILITIIMKDQKINTVYINSVFIPLLCENYS